MLISKSYLFVLVVAFTSICSLLSLNKYFSLNGYFSTSFSEKIVTIFYSTCLDTISLSFLRMVCLVTRVVFLYSEVYIETYKNKKFFSLTLTFFLFMVVLSTSRAFMNLIIGWDGLGISSLLLIMFYPNKITLFNSFLTFFFNRVGDIFFLIFFCLFLESYTLFFYLNNLEVGFILFLFFLGLITKRAQIPFSSWLPAAMSAPTPISAIVHSSTLVTAGIFVFFKFHYFFWSTYIFRALIFIRIFTFLLGGLLGVLELDLKKIVAFSTMRQIRIILFFISVSLFSLASIHTFGHALFKTLLFCGCGVLFMWKYRDQLSISLGSSLNTMRLRVLFICRIYSIRGLVFSSSFFTKDLVMELLLERKNSYLFLFLLLGRSITIIYRSKIYKCICSKPALKNFGCYKSHHFLFLFLFVLGSVSLIKLFIEYSLISNFPLLEKYQVLLLNVIIISFFLMNIKSKFIIYLRREILFLKNFFFRVNSKIFDEKLIIIFQSDSFLFKPRLFGVTNLIWENSSSKFWVYPFIFLFFFFI